MKAPANAGADADAADGDAVGEPRRDAQAFTHDTVPSMPSRTKTMTAACPKKTAQDSNSRLRTPLNSAKAKPAKARAAAGGVAAAAAAATGSATVRGRHSRATQPRNPRLSGLTSSRSMRASPSMLRRSSTTRPRRPKNRRRLQASRTRGDAVPLFVNRSPFPAKACRPRPQISHHRRRSSPAREQTSRPPRNAAGGVSVCLATRARHL